LVCHAENNTDTGFGLPTCSPPGAGKVDAPPFWPGSNCYPDNGFPQAYFHIPRQSDVEGDAEFFRLPFPNDVRRVTNGLDLHGFPDPRSFRKVAPFFEDFDYVTHYLERIEKIAGFSTLPAIYFRFSQPFSEKTADPRLSPHAIRLVDITPDSPTYGEDIEVTTWMASGSRLSRYICPNWVAIRPTNGTTLRPGTTYAAILNKSIKTMTGEKYRRPDDLDLLLADTAPKDARYLHAYNAYKPLRTFIREGKQDKSQVLNATVFTTQGLFDQIPAIRGVIRERPAAEISSLTDCDSGAISPCQTVDQTGTLRGACGVSHPDYVELHGRITLPLFQKGQRPYQTYDGDGAGGVVLDSNGVPEVQDEDAVCFALTIPRSADPPYPLLIAAHGIDGSFTTAIDEGKAAMLASGEAPYDVRAATLAIDMPQHGMRRGTSLQSPGTLFYNFPNPDAARDNITQGSADLLSLVFWAQNYRGSILKDNSNQEIFFDPKRIVLYAHSQSATHASLMIAFEPGLLAVVLSGNGGDLSKVLVNKTQPYNIPYVMSMIFADPSVCPIGVNPNCIGEINPMVSLVQTLFDIVDPVHYARLLMDMPSPHVFMTYGRYDTYSPEVTIQAYAKASGMPIVIPDLENLSSSLRLPLEAPGLAGNVTTGDRQRTMGIRQYMPISECEDGHFVSTCTEQGQNDTMRFILQALGGQTPQIGSREESFR
jgi:hypothetical protein